jgi:ABC-type lipoprotein release transport system permease subunit
LYAQLAWRNIWRNPKRTAIILIAVFIGVWTMIFLGGTMSGMYDSMVENALSTLTGHIQIHHPGFRNDPVVENRMPDPAFVERVLDKTLPKGSRWVSRVRVPAVVQNARHSAGATLVGVDPEKEPEISFIGKAVTEGRFLRSGGDEHHAVIGKALAEDFETGMGKKIILMAQGAGQEIASKAYILVGLFQAGMESTEKSYLFITRESAQSMLGIGDAVTEFEIWLPDIEEVPRVLQALDRELPDEDYEVAGYRELMPLITAQIDIWKRFMIIWYLVVFIAMGFGVVNTILMAVMERVREFGLLKALGMRPYKITLSVIWEGIFILVLGMVAGNLLGAGSVWVAARTGIDLTALAAGTEQFQIPRIIYPTIHLRDMIQANAVVLVLGIAISVYPAVRAARFKPVEALTHV